MGRKQCLNPTGGRRNPTRAYNAEVTDIAWERLRRNADYRREYEAMIASSPDGAVTEEFRRKWGICFRP
ncbi:MULTISPECIES: transcriptional regulator domain-containing protein [Bradyrhizobium]|uniref:transcriptional regulator domain-containing protein n=1 Tax=Bradyrhizobium TaxID=374 RepID=UPI0030B82AC6